MTAGSIRPALKWSFFRALQKMSSALVKLASRTQPPHRRTWRRHRFEWRSRGACRRHDDLLRADEPDSRDRHPERASGRAAGRRESRSHAGRAAVRILLRTRPIQPAGLHDRRQCRRKRRWAAHARLWRHDKPRARTRSVSTGWNSLRSRRACIRIYPGTT